MKHLNFIFALTTLMVLISCNKKEEEITQEELPIGGFYRIDRMISSEQVDLNGDGQFSDNLKNEIEHFFENGIYDLEIRPHSFTDSPAQLVSINIPEPYLYPENPVNPKRTVDHVRNVVGLSYKFEKNFLLDTQSNTEVATILEFELMEDERIRTTFSNTYFDLSINEWKELIVEVFYIKVDPLSMN